MLGQFAHLVDGGFQFEVLETGRTLARAERTHILVQCVELGTKVEEVDESILLVANIDEGRIESRHNLTNSSQVDVTHGESTLTLLLAQLDKHFVLGKSDGHFGRRYVNYQFLTHRFLLNWRTLRNGIGNAQVVHQII